MRLSEFEKITDLLAREHKIRVSEGNAWAANIREKIIFYKKKDIYNLPEDHLLGMLLHEIAHIHYTTETKLPDENKEIMHATLNMLEDVAIEKIIGQDYPNAGEILDETREEVMNILIKMLPKMQVTLHEKSLLYAAARFDGRGWSWGINNYEKIGEEIAKIMTAKKDELLNRKKTADLLPLAEEIVKMLLDKFGAIPDGDLRRIMIEAQGQGQGTANSDNSRAKISIAKGLGGKGYQGFCEAATNIEYVDKIIDQVRIIGRQLRSILKRNNAMEHGGRFRTGKLMSKRLIRVRTVKDQRIFGRKIVKSNLSYAFAIASDVSGSMFGTNSKIDPASYAASAMMMTAGALRIAGISRSLILFGARAIEINPINRIDIKWQRIADDRKMHNAGNNSTNIHLAMEKARKQLNNIRAERKIMIILTDGSSDRNKIEEEYKKAKNENIQVIGIIIEDGDHHYMTEVLNKKDFIIVNPDDTSAIGPAFIKILKDNIKLSPTI